VLYHIAGGSCFGDVQPTGQLYVDIAAALSVI